MGVRRERKYVGLLDLVCSGGDSFREEGAVSVVYTGEEGHGG